MNYEQDLFDAQVQKVAEDRVREILSSPKDLLKVVERQSREMIAMSRELTETKTELKTVSTDYSRLTNATGNYDMKDAAKLLKYQRADSKQVGRTELFAFLRDIQFLNRNNTPAQTSIDNGWADEITGTYTQDGVEQTYVKSVVTPKGLEKIRRMMESMFDEWWAQ